MTEQKLESLDLNLLLVLHWLLTERSVTRAADRVGLSQPATSRALGRLRLIFKDPLLVRTGGQMVPTKTAEKLQPAIAHAVENLRTVLKISDDFVPAKQTGRYRIACTDYVGAIIALAWSESIGSQAPNLELDIVNLTLDVTSDLISGAVDLVILPDSVLRTLPAGIDADQFVRRELFQQNYMCAMRKGHPLAKSKLSLKHYVAADHILVTPSGTRLGIVDAALEQKGLERRIAYRTSTFLLALPILQKTDCIITAPHGLLTLDKENLVHFPPPITLEGFSVSSGWHPNWTQDDRHKWVREKLFETLAKQNSL